MSCVSGGAGPGPGGGVSRGQVARGVSRGGAGGGVSRGRDTPTLSPSRAPRPPRVRVGRRDLPSPCPPLSHVNSSIVLFFFNLVNIWETTIDGFFYSSIGK